MTSPFRRSHDDPTPAADALTDGQLLARLQALDTATRPGDQARLARGRVWTRLVSEHPGLGQPAASVPVRRPVPVATGIIANPLRRSPTPIGRRAAGGWRTTMDVAAVAALVIGLVLGARGVGIMPRGGNPNPMTTQSVAAAPATATEAMATDEAGTNRQPGPGPRVTPVLVTPEGRRHRIESDLVLSDGVVYTLSSISADRFAIIGSDPATLETVWSSEHAGQPVDFTVLNSTIAIITRQSDGRAMLIHQQAGSDEPGWTIDLPFDPLAVTRSTETILVSGHDASTGTPNAGEPGDMTRMLAIDATDHSIRWDIELTAPAGVEPLLTDDGIYYTTTNGGVKAIELDSGEPRWATGTGGLRITSRAVIAGSLLYVVRPDGVVFAFDRGTGDERWGQGVRTEDLGVPPLTMTIGDAERSVPAPILALTSGGQLIVGYVWSNADLTEFRNQHIPVNLRSLVINVVAFDAITGSRIWSGDAGTPVQLTSRHVELGLTVTGDEILINGSAFVSAHSTVDGIALWHVPVMGTISGNVIAIDRSVVITRNVELAVLREPVSMPSTATPAATPIS